MSSPLTSVSCLRNYDFQLFLIIYFRKSNGTKWGSLKMVLRLYQAS